MEPRPRSRVPRFSTVPRWSGRTLLDDRDWQRVGQRLSLSPRELELVQHIFSGKKMLAIAQEMELSLGTVKTYSQRVHQKLQVTDQRELTLAIITTYLST